MAPPKSIRVGEALVQIPSYEPGGYSLKTYIAFVILTLGVFSQSGGAQQPPGPPANPTAAVRSPEVHPDGRVTFRMLAPKASEVSVSGEFAVGALKHPMQKDAQGLWSVTLGPFEPENYEYDFTVDGVLMLDPRNPAVKYNRGPSAISSLLDLPDKSPR